MVYYEGAAQITAETKEEAMEKFNQLDSGFVTENLADTKVEEVEA